MSNIRVRNRFLPDNIRDIIKSLEIEIMEDEGIIFIGRSLVNRGISYKKWSQFRQSQADNREIIDAMNRIEGILEHRIVSLALTNKINTTMSIFLLKNKYNWKDSKVVDSNITIKPILAGLSNSQGKVIDATPVKPE